MPSGIPYKSAALRIEELTFFRFIAAAIVVVFHFGRDATGLTGALASGPAMVTFFFVLSGFVMGVSYFDREVGKRAYWMARIARIVPIYMVALFLTVLALMLRGDDLNAVPLFLNLTLLQAWFPPHPLSLNYPGWSLSVEMFFYFSFPYLLFAIKKYRLSAMTTTAVAFTVWGLTQIVTAAAVSGGYYGGFPSFSHDLIFYFPPAHLCSFLLGISGAMWALKNKTRTENAFVSVLLVAVPLLLIAAVLDNKETVAAYFGMGWPVATSFFAPLFLLFILGVAKCRSGILAILAGRPFVLLGEASYSLYILQLPMHLFYTQYLSGFFNLRPLHDFMLFFALLTATSVIALIVIEKPANRWIRNKS